MTGRIIGFACMAVVVVLVHVSVNLSDASGAPGQQTLSVAKAGPGAGTVTGYPAGIDCGAVCAYGYDADTTVALTATPGLGSIFVGWSGAGCSGTGACNVLMSAARNVKAVFGPADDPLDYLKTRLTIDLPIKKIVYGNNTYVALAMATDMSGHVTQKLFLSQDGITWTETPVPPGSPSDTFSINLYYYDGKFVKIDLSSSGNSNKLFASSDGVNWVEKSVPNVSDFGMGFYYYNSDFYASGTVYPSGPPLDCGKFYKSADLDNWTEVFVTDNLCFAGLSYNEGTYFAVGTTGTNVPRLFISANGVNWTEKSVPSGVASFNVQSCANKYFAIEFSFFSASRFFVSTDLMHWSNVIIEDGFTPYTANSFACYDNSFLLYGYTGDSARLLASSDGISWTVRSAGVNLSLIQRFTYLNNTFFVSGPANPGSPNFYSSYDGFTWTGKSFQSWIYLLNDTYFIYGASYDASNNVTGIIMQSPKVSVATLHLSSGWNFISFPQQPPNNAVTEVFRDVSANVVIIWGYDNGSKLWKKWKPTVTEAENSLHTVDSGAGYWVYMNSSGPIYRDGWSSPHSQVSLSGGWNLMGYAGTDGKDVTEGLASGVADKWDILWGWDSGAWSAKHRTLSALPFSLLDKFRHGRAYWVKMKEAAEWQQ